MRNRARQSLASLIAAAALSPAIAPAEATDQRLHVAGSLQRSAGGDGGNGSVGWSGRFGDRTLLLALEHNSIGGSHWTLARASAGRRYGTRIGVTGTVDVGPAELEGEDVTFRKANADVAYVLSPRWSLRALGTFVDVEPVRGSVMGIGGGWAGDGRLSVQTQIAASTGGNLDERSAMVRFDYGWRALHAFAGAAVALTNGRQYPDIAAPIFNRRLVQRYAAVVLPRERFDITVSADYSSGDVRRKTLAVALRILL